MDLLRVRVGEGEDAVSRVVLNVASAGISGGVARRINAMPVRRPTVYLTEALRAVVRYRPFAGRVTVDGELFHDGGIYLLAVANGPSFGKGMKVAPQARVDDGQADVVVVKALPAWRVPFELPRLYLGNLLSSSKVAWCRGRRVSLEPAGVVPPLEIDGETLPGAATDFEILPGVLRFLR
jgi:diacylglycerol kinase (ATP)